MLERPKRPDVAYPASLASIALFKFNMSQDK